MIITTAVKIYNHSWLIDILLQESRKSHVFSQFALDENYNSNDNNISIAEDLNDIDTYTLEEDDTDMLARSNILIDVGDDQNPNAIDSHLVQSNQSILIGIWSQQDFLIKQLSTATFNPCEKVEIS